jgi:NAD(P)-dependent dehydrogenase (short-subunit alcohol dehydrogenase family)
MSDRNDLAGRVAIVTGAAQGVGEATARALANRGASLVLTDRKADQVQAVAKDLADQVPTTAILADLSDPAGPPQVIEGALAEMGQIDLLASVAGLGLRGTILDTSVELWNEMVNLNLRSHFQLIQGVARNLVERDAPGSIAVAGSMNALGGQSNLCAYSAAKGGLVTLVRHCAHALLPHRIRVNIVNFGWMHTTGELEIQASAHGQDEAGLLQAASELPFGRLIEPAEAARLVEYLLTDDSSVMTGSTINFDQSVPGSGPTTEPRSDRLT